MASVNNMFIGMQEPYKRYTKTIKSKIAGFRLDPFAERMRPLEFILHSNTPEFQYENDVLELYTADEDQYFMRANRALIQGGFIKEFTGSPSLPSVDKANFMTDEDIDVIASVKSPTALKKRIATITSKVTLERILMSARKIGLPARSLDIIETRMAELS